MLIAIVAFVAAVAGVWAGRELFPSPPSPGVELHSLLHDGLELDEAQQTKLQMLESHFTVRRRALELELRADNALKRPGFSGGSFHWAMQPYRGSRGLHSNCLRLQRAGCAR